MVSEVVDQHHGHPLQVEQAQVAHAYLQQAAVSGPGGEVEVQRARLSVGSAPENDVVQRCCDGQVNQLQSHDGAIHLTEIQE